MKRIALILIILSCCCCFASAQEDIGSGPNPSRLSFATLVESDAWVKADDQTAPLYWMIPNRPITRLSNVSNYWKDDWYEETTGDEYSKIVYYNEGDNVANDSCANHSAVVSSVPGYYESKWGSLPLVRHLPDVVPPGYGTVKRYFKPIIDEIQNNGLISCSLGDREIHIGNQATYAAPVPADILNHADSYEHVIETAKGENAVDERYAIVVNESNQSMEVTFTKPGIYEMYFRYYWKNNLIGQYYFEPIVIK